MTQAIERPPALSSRVGERHIGIEDIYAFRAASQPSITADGRLVAFVVTQADRETDRQVGHVWIARDGDEARPLTSGDKGESLPAFSPDGTTLAFLAARGEGAKPQVWVIPVAGGEARRLTDASLGVSDFRWSPDGSRIAYVAAVDTGPKDRPEAAPRVVRRLVYKADGIGIVGDIRAHLFIVEAAGGDPMQLTSGDHSVSAPAWSPDGSSLACVTAMHDDRDLDLAQHVHVLPATGGEVRRLTPNGWQAAAPLWTADGLEVLFAGTPRLSALQAHIYGVRADGGEPRDLLPGFDRNVMVGAPAYPGCPPQLSADGNAVIFCARVRGCVHAFRVPLRGGAPEPLLGGEDQVVAGVAAATRSERMVAIVCTPDSPGDVTVLDSDGSRHQLTQLNRERLLERPLVHGESRWVKGPDGTEVEAWLWRAPDPGAPLLLDIHGGPHNAWHPALNPLIELWRQDLVARGWSVLAVNPRGSDGYGEAFTRAALGGWGEKDFGDFMAAVDDCIAEGIADPDRLAVTGYSYGGFMTAWIAGHSDRFRAAVAGGVVVDLASAYGTMDLGSAMFQVENGVHLHEDRDLYARLSPITSAEKITAPLLILHGEADDRCPVGQAEELFTALRQQRREVELVRYPGASHLFIVSGRPSHIVDYGRRVVDWVTRHVGGAVAGATNGREPFGLPDNAPGSSAF